MFGICFDRDSHWQTAKFTDPETRLNFQGKAPD